MVWVFQRGELVSGSPSNEVRDCKILVWPNSADTQCCAWSARLPSSVLGESDGDIDISDDSQARAHQNIVQLVVPLPVARSTSCEAPGVFHAERSSILVNALEMASGCFPAVVPESKVLSTIFSSKNDMSDDGLESDGDDDLDDGASLSIKQHALQMVCDAEHERLERGLCPYVSKPEIMSFERVCDFIGIDASKGSILMQNVHGSEVFVVASFAPKRGSHEMAVLGFHFAPGRACGDDDTSFCTLWAPISNVPVTSDIDLSVTLFPVTQRMDHQIYSIGAERRSGEPNGAGKNPSESAKDIRLRHASGSATVVVDARWTFSDLIRVLEDVGDSGAQACDSSCCEIALRQRKIVGPFNTAKDLAFVKHDV